jgi:hypothetical protein
MSSSHPVFPTDPELSDLDDGDAFSDAMSIGEFVKPLFAHRMTLLLGAMMGFFLAIAVILILPQKYDVSMEIGPADADLSGMGSAPSIAGGAISSLARLTGFGGGASNANLDLLVELMKSERLAARIESKDHFLERIYPERWDAVHKRWKESTGVIGAFVNFLREAVGRPRHNPDAITLADYISDHVSIETDSLSNFTTIMMTDADQQLASDLVTAIVREADAIAREDDVKLARAHVQYLQSQLIQVQTLDHREAITSLLTDEERKIMLTQSNLPYLYKLVDPDRIERSKSITVVILIVGVFAGLFIAAILVFLRGFSKRPSYRFLRWLDPGAVPIV